MKKLLMQWGVLKRYERVFFLLLTVLSGIIILFPYHNIQLHLAQGDHGNNLYAFRKTMEGAMPYRDYWWVYGPLMPYYYGLFLRFLGVNIHSVIIGYTFLHFLCGIMFYLSARIFFSGYLAYTAAMFFWIYNTPFEHTYNHIGGILMIIAVVYFLLKYLKKQNERYLKRGLFCIYILSLIKLNFGFSTLAGFFASLYLIDTICKVPFDARKKKVYVLGAIVLPALMVFSYGIFVIGLPMDVIRQCLLLPDTDPNHSSIWVSLKLLKDYYGEQMVRQKILGLTPIIFGSLAYAMFLAATKRLKNFPIRQGGLIVAVLLILTVFNWHEFLVSGVTYRLFWVEPLRIMLIFVVIGVALRHLPFIGRLLVCLAILWITVDSHLIRCRFLKIATQYFPHERAKVFVTNDNDWLTTVYKTAIFLKEHLDEKETFLALPSEQLYYFLTDKDSPTRQSEFGLRMITEEQEKEVIRAMEEKNIRYVILSNHYRRPETGLGVFGEAYCRLLAAYLKDNFKPLTIFGDWRKDPEWFTNHSILILKRVPKEL